MRIARRRSRGRRRRPENPCPQHSKWRVRSDSPHSLLESPQTCCSFPLATTVQRILLTDPERHALRKVLSNAVMDRQSGELLHVRRKDSDDDDPHSGHSFNSAGCTHALRQAGPTHWTERLPQLARRVDSCADAFRQGVLSGLLNGVHRINRDAALVRGCSADEVARGLKAALPATPRRSVA